MKPDRYKESLQRLHKLLSKMDLPGHRKTPVNRDGLRWLAKCLRDRNSGHPDYAEATRILTELGYEQAPS